MTYIYYLLYFAGCVASYLEQKKQVKRSFNNWLVIDRHFAILYSITGSWISFTLMKINRFNFRDTRDSKW